MSEHHRVIAIGLLTEHDLAMLGEGFRRIYPLDGSHDFAALLGAIDAADRAARAASADESASGGRADD